MDPAPRVPPIRLRPAATAYTLANSVAPTTSAVMPLFILFSSPESTGLAGDDEVHSRDVRREDVARREVGGEGGPRARRRPGDLGERRVRRPRSRQRDLEGHAVAPGLEAGGGHDADLVAGDRGVVRRRVARRERAGLARRN